MSTARTEEIIKKGFLKSLLEGTLEIKDLSGINVNLDLARQAYLQGVQETTLDLMGKEYVLVASDEEQLADDSEEVTQQVDYVKFKQFSMLSSGTIRVKGQIKATAPAAASVELRINGIEIGESWSTTEETYQDKESDIAAGQGDLVQLWMKTTQAGSNAFLRNAKICADQNLDAPAVGVVS